MALFGRKDEEDYEDEDELDLEEQKKEKRDDKRLTRKFRDLSPENKKKRKEPPKPWGRKERLIVLVVLLATVATSAILALSARDYNLPGFPKISPSGGFRFSDLFGEEKIVLGKKSTPDTKLFGIKREFLNTVENLSGTYTFYLIELGSGGNVGLNEDEIMTAASLIKLPVFIKLYKEVESGNINLNEKYTLKDSDKKGGAGSLSRKPAGTVVTYRELARLMGRESDNTAFNILRNKFGDEKIELLISDLGMTKTSLKENTTSARDIGTLFQKLMEGDIVSEDHKKEILTFLTDTIYEDWLVMGLPPEVKMAHKFGREVHVVCDAGIVYADKPYVVVIMGDGIIEKEADEVFPKLSKLIFEGMKK